MPTRMRNRCITLFVIVWLALFHYESLRANYLCPLFGRSLAKCKFLFPPAGWIMFYNVGESEVRAEVFGLRNGTLEPIDSHQIFENRWIGYDNIRRNVLVSVLYPHYRGAFIRYLKRKFPRYERFVVAEAVYPSCVREPGKKILHPAYVS